MIDLHHLPGSALQESQITVFRRHPITLLPTFISAILVFIIPVASYLVLNYLKPGIFDTQINFTLYLMGASIFFLFALLFVFQTFMEYWLDVFIVTDKRILDIDQNGLFSRTVSELRLYRTQDVTSQVKGFVQSMFNYGDIFVQTAGEQERFHFEDIHHPNEVAKLILELSEKDRSDHLEEAVEDFGMPDRKADAAPIKKIAL